MDVVIDADITGVGSTLKLTGTGTVWGPRIRLLVAEGFGVLRQLPSARGPLPLVSADAERSFSMTRSQFDVLVVGLLWARLQEVQRIDYV